MNLIAVMLGGAVGAGLRYGLAAFIQSASSDTFPYGTLAANILGCLLIGILTGLFANAWPVPEWIRLCLIVGVLGGFTTFSSFGLETISLIQDGRLWAATLYVVVSNLGGLLSVFIGLKLGN